MRWKLILACSIAYAISYSGAAVGQEWEGKRVILKSSQFHLWVDNQPVVRSQLELRIYTVERVEGSMLWLHDPGIEGWAYTDQVVDVDHAIDYFTEVIRLSPQDADAYTHRAWVWQQVRHELDPAQSDYTKAIKLEPRRSCVWENRGLLYALKGEQDKAIKDFSSAIRLDPTDAIAYRGRGLAWHAKRNEDKAIADYSSAIKFDPESPLAFNRRGNAWRSKGRYDKAIADYDRALRLDPKFTWAWLNRAIVGYLSQKGSPIRDARMAISSSGWKDPLAIRAAIIGYFAALRLNKPEEANRFLEIAVAKADHSLWPYPVVAYLRDNLDEKELLERAPNRDKMTEVRCYLGMAAEQNGEKKEALEYFQWIKDEADPVFVEFGIALVELERIEKQ